MPGLCADVISGQDFLCLHEEVVIKLGRSKNTLLVDNNRVCGVAACKVNYEQLFQNFKSDWHPIATKSRKFSTQDKQFINAEVTKLLKASMIESSYLPWHAQMLVARDECHKPQMVVDYSQTINRYTLLDTYPLPSINEKISEIAKGSIFSTLI